MGRAVIGGSLFRRFFLRFLCGVGVAALVFMALIHLFQARVVDSEWREELHQEAEWLARHTHANASSMLAGAWKTMHSAVRVTFYDLDGELLADSHPERAPIDLAALRGGKEPGGQLAVVADLVQGGMLVMSRPYVPSFPAGLRWELAAALLLIIGPMVLLLYPLVRSMSSVLRELGDMAQRVSSGQFGETLDVPRSDEVGALVQSFNDMSRKLAEAERLNSRLLHDVSHELRSPLGRIQVLADTIARRPRESADCLRAIEQEVGLLDRLVGDLLQVARLDAGEPNARIESFSVQHWAKEAFARLERSARSQGVEWTAHLPEDDRHVRGDPQHLVQALANLVDNAIHALAGREDASIEVSVAFEDANWTLSVADNGPGISEEHLQHVFRRFYRADEHRDRDTGGVGLGLSLVRAIAEGHGGCAQVESGCGRGTTITMTLAMDGGGGS